MRKPLLSCYNGYFTELIQELNMQPMLSIAIKAVRRAATVIARGSLDMEQNKVEINRKGPNDYVTSVDIAAEQAIIEVLREAYPEHAVLGEESGLVGTTASEYVWVIDPLDGTRNFVHGIPNYAISVALTHRGIPQHAAIYDPNLNEMFTASRGSGMFLNDRRVRVSTRRTLDEAILSGRCPKTHEADLHRQFFQLMNECSAYRQLGSSVLELAYLAAGRVDIVFNTHLKPWDMAAGSLLILEAGGLIGDFQGEQNWQSTGDIIAANPRLFAKAIQAINH